VPDILVDIRYYYTILPVLLYYCSARFVLHCGLEVGGVSWWRIDPVVSTAVAVFEQMWCVDWLQTATVYTVHQLDKRFPAMKLQRL